MKSVCRSVRACPGRRTDMNTRCGIYLQRRENVPVGTLWLNTARGKLSSVFSYAADWLKAPATSH